MGQNHLHSSKHAYPFPQFSLYFAPMKQQLRKIKTKISNRFSHPFRPIDSWASTQQWLSSKRFNRGLNSYKKLYSESAVNRVPPKTLDSEIQWQFLVDYGNTAEAAFVAQIRQGRFWSNSAVITSDNKLLADVSPVFKMDPRQTPEKHPVFWKDITPPQKMSGNIGVLAAPGGNTYFHWMIDVVPRLHLLREWEKTGQKIDRFIVNGTSKAFQQQTLEMMGIDAHQIIDGSAHPHIVAEQLIVPSFPRHNTCLIAKWVFQYIRDEFIGGQSSVSDMNAPYVYVSRARASRRRMTNEDSILSLLEPYGFQTFFLEELSFAEQISLFSNAKCIVSPHGAGLTNLVFASPGAKIIEIYSPNYVSVSYWNISSQIGLDYYYLFGEGKRPEPYTDPHGLSEDITVDVAALEKILKLAEI
jgi:capsular polysaccharide biosynthesis protein